MIVWEGYLYLILRIKTVVENISVIAFAMMTGGSLMRTPYMNHRKMPVVSVEYIPNDRSFVCLVLSVLITCGRNEMVVHVAAINPIVVIQFMVFHRYPVPRTW